ncbi:MAG TPA: VIT1/CCC1 transporter family protein [Thermoanaerobaculia bacterium]|nr:VIT1/CCC1 transporter family protein [Thermoanaerobaculia bacterium]
MAALTSREKARLLDNLVDELNGAALYDALADAEKDQRLSEVYRRLAIVERKHADRWQRKLEEAGETLPSFAPSWRTRTLSFLARRFGTNVVLPSVQQLERADTNKYAGQSDARDFHGEERSHSRVIRLMSSMRGGFAGSEVARLEGRHRSAGGNALRAAVLGANDGLVSNLSLVMGVAGAALNSRAILITGFAGLLAGAGSMALGEWLSVQSSRELYEHQLETEAEEIANMPEEEEEELALIYQARGLDEAQAREFASSMMQNQESAIEAMAREELGIDPQELGGSAWEAAILSFLLFSIGAIVPVIPFLFATGTQAVVLSAIFAMFALFLLGGAITLFTGRGVLMSGLRQVVFGLGAAALTFGVGKLIGVSVAG